MTDSHLRPCPSCARHVRVNEGGCPFCGQSLADSFRASPRPQAPTARLTRAALFALGAGAVGLAPGCSASSSASPTAPSEAGPIGTAQPVYGAPAMEEDAASDAGVASGDAGVGSSDATVNADGPVAEPAYGAPPIEVMDASEDHHVGVIPLYGATPIETDASDVMDAREDHHVGVLPLYGATPIEVDR